MTTDRTWPSASCSWKSPNCGLDDSLGTGLMSFWAKNASTTTMRIWNAALLKNLLMWGSDSGPVPYDQSINSTRVLSADWYVACTAEGSVLRLRVLLQCGNERQVAVPLAVIEAVADGEAIGDLEAHVAGVEVDLAPLGLGQQRADLDARRPAGAQVAQQVLQGQPRVDDVLND